MEDIKKYLRHITKNGVDCTQMAQLRFTGWFLRTWIVTPGFHNMLKIRRLDE